jgi:hypothetical protein
MTSQAIPEAARRRSSARYRLLVVLGWLCIAATIGIEGFVLIWLLSSLWILFDAIGVAAICLQAFTIATFGIAIGLALLTSARACRPDAQAGRFKLWAKLLLFAAVEMIVVFPLYCYSTFLYLRVLGYGYADPLDPALFGAAAQAASTPFLIGIVALVAALIWGRRKPEPDIPAVFG